MTRPDAFHVYDTTLRDGAQREGISYSVNDKLAVARLLDEYGVGFIEGGWPGAMPKDTEFFSRARTELSYVTPSWWLLGRLEKRVCGSKRICKFGLCSTPKPR